MEGAPAANIQLFGRNVGAVLRRIVGQLEEGAAERGRGLGAIGHMPDLHARQPVEELLAGAAARPQEAAR